MSKDKKIAARVLWSPQLQEDGFVALCENLEDCGADEVFLEIPVLGEENPEEVFALVKAITRVVDIPIFVEAPLYRLEDVKKFLYAGAAGVVFQQGQEKLFQEASDRFGGDKCWCKEGVTFTCEKSQQTYAEVLGAEKVPEKLQVSGITGCYCTVDISVDSETELSQEVLSLPDFHAMKQACLAQNIPVNTFQSSISWSEFKTNEQGLIPVIVQDYKTNEVLMMAYMNEEAFQKTCETGRMTYFSRSRQSLWLKGETSGHFQYVKSVFLDCDNDTILAKVKQIGVACHTGARSCFFKPLVQKAYADNNPLQVLEQVYAVIADRKENPKEGSYTNYLFNKGIDKILKKLGEEATEIVIAAKNPDPEEIKYEISDFLYHAMVLMVEKGVSWSDITKELANR